MGGMDLRTRTSLFCGVLALAIAVSVLLKGKPRLPQLFFTGLAGDIGLWYLAQWLYHVGQWVRCVHRDYRHRAQPSLLH